MTRQFRVISGREESKKASEIALPEEKLKHFKNITSAVLKDALNTWAELWNELDNSVVHGYLVTPEAEKGFKPACGWPEFLEKMWLLKHYLDYAKRSCDAK
jgi:hypothetical protein